MALALGVVLGAILLAVFVALRDERARTSSELVDRRLETTLTTALRSVGPRGLALDGDGGPGGAERRLSEAEVAAFVPGLRAGLQSSGVFVYDAETFYRAAPQRVERYVWPEHPRGAWTSATNSDGAREDHELGAIGARRLVVVAGDSQTEGMCDNVDTFCSDVERRLEREHGLKVELYDTGLSGYTFQNYAGVLRRYADRGPEVFVTVVYGGNDFVEAVRLERVLRREARPAAGADYDARLVRARELSTVAFSQGLNQLLYFQERPSDVELAFDAARDSFEEIAARCREQGVVWILVYLPTPLELDREPWSGIVRGARERLGIDAADLARISELVERSLGVARALGATVLDLRPALAAARERCFWSELHLDLDGHALVGAELAPAVLAALGPRTER
ncbi:MAG: SGNH/GDSL hydrolase family protein [Planctomycetes bacterium]|nr:SGNH/GDSL hydrolase family protein [Planctomycetota bacterium]